MKMINAHGKNLKDFKESLNKLVLMLVFNIFRSTDIRVSISLETTY